MFEVVAQGEGPLFMDPDADKAREFFRHKYRALVSKVTTVKEAVKKFIHDGDYLAIGGFGANRIPTAVCMRSCGRGRKTWALPAIPQPMTFRYWRRGRPSTAATSPTSSAWKRAAFPRTPGAPWRAGKSELRVDQLLAWLRIKAAAMGLSFLPGRNIMGTDTFKYSAAKEISAPSPGKLYCHPALYPDVAAIHVHEAMCTATPAERHPSPTRIWPGPPSA